jgi:hypothetical protein
MNSNPLDANSFAKTMFDLKKGDASISDLLTGLKNLVSSVNNISTIYQQINGIQNKSNLSGTSPIVVKNSSSRVALISVIEAGSTVGYVYDSSTSTINAETPKLYVIPNEVGIFNVNMPANFGILVSPGTDQIITISYS